MGWTMTENSVGDVEQTVETTAVAPKRRREVLWILAVALIVLLSRIPFLDAGYGNDSDAWLVAGAARSIGTTGEYVASRLPGNPVQELTCALFWWGGPVLLNGLTALLSAVAVFFFAMSLREFRSKFLLLATLALACVPIFFVNSTVTMDYVWALAFVMVSLYMVLRGKALTAGFFLGLAIGCRITSGAMIIPLALFLSWVTLKKLVLKKIFYFAASGLIMGGASFLPLILTYGSGFFTYYESPANGFFSMLKGASEDLWGAVGLLGIVMAVAFQIIYWIGKRKASPNRVTKLPFMALFAVCSAVALYAAAYSITPFEPEYLLPIVPFVLILLANILNRKLFVFMCICLIASPFVISFGRFDTDEFVSINQWNSDFAVEFSLGGKPYFVDPVGPVITDFNRRLRVVRYIDSVLNEGSRMDDESVIIAGRWVGPLAVAGYDDLGPDGFREFLRDLNDPKDIPSNFRLKSQQNVVYEHYLSREDFERYANEGYQLYYSPDYRMMNILIHDLDLKAVKAKPLPIPD